MTAPARGVLCCRIDLLTAFGAQAPVAAPEPGNIDGALEQIGSGELGALSDLCLPGSADLLANTPVHILRVSIDRCSHQSFMVEMRSGDLASKCFRGIVWSRIGDAQQVAQRGAFALVVVDVATCEVGRGERGNEADENGYTAAGAQGTGEGCSHSWHFAAL